MKTYERLTMHDLKIRIRAARHHVRNELKIGGDPIKNERLDYAYDLTEHRLIHGRDATKNLHHHATRVREHYRRLRNAKYFLKH